MTSADFNFQYVIMWRAERITQIDIQIVIIIVFYYLYRMQKVVVLYIACFGCLIPGYLPYNLLNSI